MILPQIRSKFSQLIAAPLGRWVFNRLYTYPATTDKIIWVNLNQIQHWYRGNRYDQVTYPGQIKGGDWSKKMITREKRLTNRSGYVGLYERFQDGKPWRETKLFKEKHAGLLETRGEVKGMDNLGELERYYEERYDRLFEKIKKEGLLPANSENPEIDPIYIHIGPKGELIYTVDGNHRFYMAEILGIEKMPVKVWMRHKQWQQIREHILGRNGQDVNPEYETYLEHPDIVSELN
jgi:hypothetical protein